MSSVAIYCQSAAAASNFDGHSDHNANNHEDANKTCERLLQVSFSKIVNSKNERGGAKLRKNLLIVHLIQRAQSEKRAESKSATTSPPPDDNNGHMSDDVDEDSSSLSSDIDNDIADDTLDDDVDANNAETPPPVADWSSDQNNSAPCDSCSTPCSDNDVLSIDFRQTDASADDANSTCSSSSSSSSDDFVSEDEEQYWQAAALHDCKNANQQARKRKISTNHGALGVSTASNKRPRELCATDSVELQGLIDVFTTGLAGVGSPAASISDSGRRNSSSNDHRHLEEECSASSESVFNHSPPSAATANIALTCVS